jgi:mono/diheme cytochrome c family protein
MGDGAIDITGESATSIRNHIAAVAEMNHLNFLTDPQLKALEGVIAKKVAPIDGAALYAANCNGCHFGGKKDKTAAQITTAIKNVPSMSGQANLKALTAAQIQAIADLQ